MARDRREYNRRYSARPEVIEKARIKNATPEAKLKRKLYKKTPQGRERENTYRRKRYAQIADERRFVRYGITPEEFDQMFQSQDGKCAICRKVSKYKLHIDHSHESGAVRGLLCGSCNRGIGMFLDNPSVVQRAVDYLLGF